MSENKKLSKVTKFQSEPVSKALSKRHPDSVVKDGDDVDDVKGEKLSKADERIAVLEKQVKELSKPRVVESRLSMSPPAKQLLYDAKDAIARGLASPVAYGQASVRFDLETEEELEGARELEQGGYGHLSRVGAKNAPEVICSIHGNTYPCALGQKKLGSGVPVVRGIAPDDADMPACKFDHGGKTLDGWVFEFTSVTGPRDGGVLRGSSIDEDR